MAYKLVCIHEFHDSHTGKMINRGDEIHDYDHLAKIHHGTPEHPHPRGHHFTRVHVVMEPDQWEWPPHPQGRAGLLALKKASEPAPAPEPEEIFE